MLRWLTPVFVVLVGSATAAGCGGASGNDFDSNDGSAGEGAGGSGGKGGASQGGSDQGGSGGSSSGAGGSSQGGSSTGGSPTGGSPTGGSPTGGSSTGGSETGGSSTGGSSTGGVSGTGTGGSSGTDPTGGAGGAGRGGAGGVSGRAGSGGMGGTDCALAIQTAQSALAAAQYCNPLIGAGVICTGTVEDLCGCTVPVGDQNSQATKNYLAVREAAVRCGVPCLAIVCQEPTTAMCGVGGVTTAIVAVTSCHWGPR